MFLAFSPAIGKFWFSSLNILRENFWTLVYYRCIWNIIKFSKFDMEKIKILNSRDAFFSVDWWTKHNFKWTSLNFCYTKLGLLNTKKKKKKRCSYLQLVRNFFKFRLSNFTHNFRINLVLSFWWSLIAPRIHLTDKSTMVRFEAWAELKRCKRSATRRKSQVNVIKGFNHTGIVQTVQLFCEGEQCTDL